MSLIQRRVTEENAGQTCSKICMYGRHDHVTLKSKHCQQGNE